MQKKFKINSKFTHEGLPKSQSTIIWLIGILKVKVGTNLFLDYELEVRAQVDNLNTIHSLGPAMIPFAREIFEPWHEHHILA